MLPVLVSVDKKGDLKIGRRKCRLHKKDMVVKIAEKYGIPTKGKTVSQLCASIKSRAKNSVTHTNNTPIAKMMVKKSPTNNTPIAKLYPKLVKKIKNREIAMNFMKGMTTTPTVISALKKLNMSPSPKPVMPKPSKKAKELTVDEAKKRIMAMKGLTNDRKRFHIYSLKNGVHSPRKVVRIARLNALLR